MENSQPESGASDLSTTDGVAEALMSKWESADTTEEPSNEEVTEESPDLEEVQATDELEGDSEESDVQDPDSEEEALSFQSIQDLSEALDLTPEQFLEQIKGKVKVNGEESEVSLSEALNGYQRQADYQRKTAELAEQRRQAEAQYTQQQAELAQRNQIAQASLQAAENALMQEFQSVNWQELETTDPATAVLYKQKLAERQSEIQNYIRQYAHQQQYEQQQMEQQREQYNRQFAHQQAEALKQADPSWDANRSKALHDYLIENNLTEQEVGSIVDHRHALIAYKAMLYDQQQKSVEVAKAKVKPLPKMLKPNSKTQKTKQSTNRDKLRAKLKKSGSVHDAASVLLERWG